MVALLEALVVLLVGVVLAYIAYSMAVQSRTARPSLEAGRWQAAHYSSAGATRVVARRVAPSAGTVLDEHVVAVIPEGDPDFDAKFLEAMATARARVALFESESG